MLDHHEANVKPFMVGEMTDNLKNPMQIQTTV